MHDEELRRLLRRLPRETAPPGFTGRVLARLDGQPARDARLAQPLAAALVLATLSVSGWLGWQEWTERRRERISRQHVETLRLEYDDLQAELGELRRMVAESQPLVAVEGDGAYDFVLDLEALARSGREGTVPVAYRLPR